MIRICISTLKTEYSDSFAKKLGISFTAVATLLNTLADSLATLRTTDLLTLSYQLYKRLTEIRFVKYDFFGQHSTFFTDSFPILFIPKTARKCKLCEEKMKETKTPFRHSFLPYFDLLHQAWTTGNELVFNCHWVQRYWINA